MCRRPDGYLAAFWKGFELGRNDCFETYDGLIGLLTNIAEDEQKSSLGQLGKINSRTKWDHLFAVLQLCPGWGEKTAALFVKAAYLIHADTKNEALRFWRNAPELVDGDRIYLPVDAVMKHIFQEHFSKRLNTFSSINNYIFQHGYTPHQMIIWDDLWFWGFITQNSKNGSRIDVWNEAKYWTQQHTCKEQSSIDEVKKRAEEFLEILKS
jgi:hypothetical protein